MVLEDIDPPPGARGRLNRDQVLRAAVALADANGLESLTTRKFGLELGIEAMSLYNHVASKVDLLDGMIDCVFAEIDPPTGEATGRRPPGDGRSRPARSCPATGGRPR